MCGRTEELSVLGFCWHPPKLMCLSTDLIWTRTNAQGWFSSAWVSYLGVMLGELQVLQVYLLSLLLLAEALINW